MPVVERLNCLALFSFAPNLLKWHIELHTFCGESSHLMLPAFGGSVFLTGGIGPQKLPKGDGVGSELKFKVQTPRRVGKPIQVYLPPPCHTKATLEPAGETRT